MTDRDGASGLPLYEQIKRALVRDIVQGGYDSRAPFVTQREVCERFGVSTITAVRALNELVGEGILVRRRGRGTFVSDEYLTRSKAAVGSKVEPETDRDRAIVSIFRSIDSLHTSLLLSGAQSVCAERGCRLTVHDSHASPERENEALREAMTSGVSGVVLYPVGGEHNVETIEELQHRGIPVVLLDRYLPQLETDAVVADNFAIGYRLTEALIEMGHQRICTLWGETDATSVRDRLTGHIRALVENDLPVRPALTAMRPYGSMRDDRRHALLTSLLESEDAPTALLCANGFILGTASTDLMALGYEVPNQVVLAGMDDVGPFDLLLLASAAASLPSRDMGERAAELLLDRLDSGGRSGGAQHVVLPIKTRVRELDAPTIRLAGKHP